MADEQQFIEQGLQRSQIDEFFAEELSRAGYGGMEVAQTPMGTQIVLKAQKPGMVIGKGGKNIREITETLETEFDLEDPQVDVQEVEEPDLNARIVADRLANALERGWYFRKAGHTTVDRVMEAGALGAEIVLAGKVTGNRGRVEKFNRGYIKHNGEPAEEIVNKGQATAVLKLGTIGVTVKIIPPDADLPDNFQIEENADIEDLVAEEAEGEGVEELLEEPPAEEEGEGEAGEEQAAETEEAPEPEAVEEAGEEIIEEEVSEEEGQSDTSPPDTDKDAIEEGLEELDQELDEYEEYEEYSEIDAGAQQEAEELYEEMEPEEESENTEEE
ncbi:MAG: 30S ribosomal protein S3 [Halobacteriaceae archaeon]